MSKKNKAQKAGKNNKADIAAMSAQAVEATTKPAKSGKSSKVEKAAKPERAATDAKPAKEAKSGKADQATAMDDRSVLLISRALADPRRVEVFRKIATSDKATCGDVSECIGMNPATLSHHMRQLETAGLIETERDGKFVRATLRRKVWKSYLNHLKELTD